MTPGIVLAVLAVAAALFLYIFRSKGSGSGSIRPVAEFSTAQEADDAVLQHLQANGSDMSKPTDIVNYLYIPSREDAIQLARQMSQGGYSTEVREPLGRLPNGKVESRYCVALHVTDVPNTANVRKMRDLMITLANKFNGEYDSWEGQLQL